VSGPTARSRVRAVFFDPGSQVIERVRTGPKSWEVVQGREKWCWDFIGRNKTPVLVLFQLL
jgi:hypothetical protein